GNEGVLVPSGPRLDAGPARGVVGALAVHRAPVRIAQQCEPAAANLVGHAGDFGAVVCERAAVARTGRAVDGSPLEPAGKHDASLPSVVAASETPAAGAIPAPARTTGWLRSQAPGTFVSGARPAIERRALLAGS